MLISDARILFYESSRLLLTLVALNAAFFLAGANELNRA